MLRFFERLLEPTGPPPDAPPPVLGEHACAAALLLAFRAADPGTRRGAVRDRVCVAIIDALIPVSIGRIVALVVDAAAGHDLADAGGQLMLMAALFLLVRPAAHFAQLIVANLMLVPGLTNLVRWQSHWHVVRQGWTFFQNDFAGRIAARVMQTGPALRESVVLSVARHLVHPGLRRRRDPAAGGRPTGGLPCRSSPGSRLYGWVLMRFLPQMRERSRAMSEMRSVLTGKIVDSYTNILTVKLFARSRDEDEFVRDAVDEHTETWRAQQRIGTLWGLCLQAMNALLMVGTGVLAIGLWAPATSGRHGRDGDPDGLADHQRSPAVWRSRSPTSSTISGRCRTACARSRWRGRCRTCRARSSCRGSPGRFASRMSASITAAGRGAAACCATSISTSRRASGSGWSAAPAPANRRWSICCSGFYRPESGRILIDGRDIAGLTQESLRAQIGMVTQDTSLLHRSIRDNIRYGRPEASEAEIVDAARRAHALEFIEGLEDWHGRTGFDAHVGERGVKLSGGQRQRIALARVILKDAPILVLDEATSALDSEVEAAIQEQLARADGRAHGHRDRPPAVDDRPHGPARRARRGRIVEEGHARAAAGGGRHLCRAVAPAIGRVPHRPPGDARARGRRGARPGAGVMPANAIRYHGLGATERAQGEILRLSDVCRHCGRIARSDCAVSVSASAVTR